MSVDIAPEGEDIVRDNGSKHQQKTPPHALSGIQGPKWRRPPFEATRRWPSWHSESEPSSDADLKLMRGIDALHLELPFAGARMLLDLLRAEFSTLGCAASG